MMPLIRSTVFNNGSNLQISVGFSNDLDDSISLSSREGQVIASPLPLIDLMIVDCVGSRSTNTSEMLKISRSILDDQFQINLLLTAILSCLCTEHKLLSSS